MKNWWRRIRRIGTWMILAAGVLLAVYLFVLRPTVVEGLRITQGPVVVEALGTGSVESRRTVDVSSEVTARLVKIHVDQGDLVKLGQELASIDDSVFLAEVALSQQEIKLAESTQLRLEADIQRARAVLQGADDALARIQPLVLKGAASEGSLDEAEERQKVAAAGLDRARAARIEGTQGVMTARRRLDLARTALERTILKSPFDGIVLRRVREVGDVAVPGAVVIKLAATDTVWASVWVDETYLSKLSVGLPAQIVLRSDPGTTLPGRVVRIGREVDRETRELLVDVLFDVLPKNLAFGQRVDLQIELSRRLDVVRIPARGIHRMSGTEGVFLKDGDQARFQPIEIGARGRELVEVVEGIDQGDTLLEPFISTSKPLKDGQKIQLKGQDEEESPK